MQILLNPEGVGRPRCACMESVALVLRSRAQAASAFGVCLPADVLKHHVCEVGGYLDRRAIVCCCSTDYAPVGCRRMVAVVAHQPVAAALAFVPHRAPLPVLTFHPVPEAADAACVPVLWVSPDHLLAAEILELTSRWDGLAVLDLDSPAVVAWAAVSPVDTRACRRRGRHRIRRGRSGLGPAKLNKCFINKTMVLCFMPLTVSLVRTPAAPGGKAAAYALDDVDGAA